jgi:hypothetical protein
MKLIMIGAMLQKMKRDRLIGLIINSFCFIFIFMGCASSTTIKSRPEGAEVFIDNVRIGVTPAIYSDTAIAGSTKQLKLKKEGYRPFDTVIRKSEYQVGPCIGGAFVLFPFIWILGYPDAHEFELEKLPEPEKKLGTEKLVLPETDKK